MPITFPALTRRRWLQGLAAASVLPSWLEANDAIEETFALLSDTHIDANVALEARGICMAQNLQNVLEQVLQQNLSNRQLFVNGDCAYGIGRIGDYEQFQTQLTGIRESGFEVKCTLGNHDNRQNFYHVLGLDPEGLKTFDHHVECVESKYVNWLLLDSLHVTNEVSGYFGEAQLKWLEDQLKAYPQKPAVVMAHHNPQTKVAEGKKWTGLKDTEALYTLLAKYPQVKAFFFGHTHRWSHQKLAGTELHLINLPPVAYVFSPELPSGWVLAKANAQRLLLQLYTLQEDHPQQGTKIEIPLI